MERVRLNLINDTMMPHPIHLHGHFFELVGAHPGQQPFKHTVNVLPGGKVSVDFTADALGDWAFHCHMLLHMMSGIFRVVTVRHEGGAEHDGHNGHKPQEPATAPEAPAPDPHQGHHGHSS